MCVCMYLCMHQKPTVSCFLLEEWDYVYFGVLDRELARKKSCKISHVYACIFIHTYVHIHTHRALSSAHKRGNHAPKSDSWRSNCGIQCSLASSKASHMHTCIFIHSIFIHIFTHTRIIVHTYIHTYTFTHIGRSAAHTNAGITRQKMTVGGVPVAFNAPWQYGISNGIFSDAGLDVVWKDCQGGTAGMAQTLTEVRLCLYVHECLYVHIYREALRWYGPDSD
jgi:hypothetical protein